MFNYFSICIVQVKGLNIKINLTIYHDMASGETTNGKGKKGSIPGTFILSLFIHLLYHAFNDSHFPFILSACHSFQFTIFPRK